MILVDTSVWIDHLRASNPTLGAALARTQVLLHPFVIGELACGNLKNRQEVLQLLGELPTAPQASKGEALAFIEERALMGRGIGYIDVHLLASALLAGSRFWTKDKRLAEVAAELGIAYEGSL